MCAWKREGWGQGEEWQKLEGRRERNGVWGTCAGVSSSLREASDVCFALAPLLCGCNWRRESKKGEEAIKALNTVKTLN